MPKNAQKNTDVPSVGVLNVTDSDELQKIQLVNLTTAEAKIQIEVESLLSRLPKVHRLHRCTSCQQGKTADKFSPFYPICKECFHDAQTKNKTSKNKFIARAVANLQRNLRGGLNAR